MIYVMSDIHGNMRRFNSIMAQINLQPDDTLYVLGDVIDRHPDGIRILRELMKMSNVKMVLGNHEYMMLQALGCPFDCDDIIDEDRQKEATRLWYNNGGKVTHTYWKRIRKDIRSEIIHYLRSLPLYYDVNVADISYKLVHAAPIDEYEKFSIFYDDPIHFAVWKRLKKHESLHGDYTLIFGHTPTMNFELQEPMKIWYGPQRIGIDCGSGLPEHKDSEGLYKYGNLACLRLDDLRSFYSEENIQL